MALMFRSVLQNAGGAAELVVTCDEEFAGATISCSDGTTTLNKTCPVSSPYTVTFKIPNSGDWTVSATVSGTTYTSDTISVSLDYTAELSFGFSWQTWVDTSSLLDSTDYSTLSDLLADEEALRELCLEHACVDYLCQSADVNPDLETIIGTDLFAKWVNNSDYALDKMYANEAIADEMDTADKYGYGEWCLMPQVPTMTSNTTPYGEVIYSSVYSTYYAYNAFDNNDSTSWIPLNVSSRASYVDYIGYEFTEARALSRVRLVVGSSFTVSNIHYKIQGYNGTAWEDVSSENAFSLANDSKVIEIECDSSKICTKFRLITDSLHVTNEYNIRVSLQFYAYAPKGNVPIMTSNTAPYGTAGGTNVYPGARDYYVAFNENGIKMGAVAFNVSSAGSIYYKAVNPICAKRASFYITNVVSPIKIVASNDGSSWDTIKTIDDVSGTYFDVSLENDDYYLYWGLQFVSNSQGGYVACVQFYGRELSVSVPAMTGNTTPYGEAIGSSTRSSDLTPFYYIFDGNDSNYFTPATNANEWIGYDFKKPVIIKQVVLTNYYGGYGVRDAKLQGYDETQSEWVDIGEQFVCSGTSRGAQGDTVNSISFADNETAYSKIRLYCIDNIDSAEQHIVAYLILRNLQFYGIEYSEKEFEEGSTKKWLYDHGLELVQFDYTSCNTASATMTNTGNELRTQIPSMSGNIAAVIQTNQKIDLTDYNYIFNRAGHEFANYAQITDVYSNKVTDYTTVGNYRIANANGELPLTSLLLALDISSVNQEAIIGLNGRKSNPTGCVTTCTELWLE